MASTTRRILIVDNDLVVAHAFTTTLTNLGYDVAGTASSAREAIALAARTEPELVLMDLELPGDMGSMAAADEIRRRWRIPIIFTTADTSEATLQRAGVTEPCDYVAKPFMERELRLTVELALSKHDVAKQIHEYEDRFFAVSIDMLCVLGFNGYFKRLNPAWEHVLGFSRAELMSRPFIEFVHPDDRDRTLKQNADVRTGTQALGFENRYRCKDGSYRWLLWNAAPDNGEHVICSVARDVTARKQADVQREELVHELRAALAEVRTLQGILPICSYCKKVRDDENYWHNVESYISDHTNTRFSHSICPSCYANVVEPGLGEDGDE